MTDVLSLLGGLALFLYGMQMMCLGLEAAAGNKIKRVLERLTSNRVLGVAVGAGMTAVIQSSSATTVMVVGFVNSGMMSLRQAVWIIMGANIGTTITGQLIALDVGMFAPVFAFVGVAMVVFIRSSRVHHLGQILAGLGVLFIGMDMMNAAMLPLQSSSLFIHLITYLSNPFIGILTGILFTALVQSSSASVGILQALAASGLIGLPSAVYVLFGQNIGTCLTAVLASVRASRDAKRTALIHLMFNVSGTVFFTLICMATPLTVLIQSLTPANPAAQIANMHTLFNVVTTLLLLPIGELLAKVSVKLLPDSLMFTTNENHLEYIKPLGKGHEYAIGFSAMYMTQMGQELGRMMEMAGKNVLRGFEAFQNRDPSGAGMIEETQEYIDYLNNEISRFVSNIIVYETNEQDSAMIGGYFKVAGNIERISDHAVNIFGYAKILKEKGINFSPQAQQEISEMKQISMVALRYLEEQRRNYVDWLPKIKDIAEQMDDMTILYRQCQMERMKMGICSGEASIFYSEMLTDFERIGDHYLNIAQELYAISQYDGDDLFAAANEN